MEELEEKIKDTFERYIVSFYDAAPSDGSHRY